MRIKNKFMEFSKVRSENPEVVDNAFNENLSYVRAYPDIEEISFQYTGLEENHLEILIENLANHKNLKRLNLGTNFLNKPHENLMGLIAQLVREHPEIKEVDLERCKLKDKDIADLFSKLTKKEIESIFFRISRNQDLTLKTAKLILKSNSYKGTIKSLGDNLNINRTNSPEKERIKYFLSQPWIPTTSEEESESEEETFINNSIKSYNPKPRK